MGDVEGFSDDVALGMGAMSAFTKIPERKLYHLASTGQLPGAFRLGRNWALMKSVYAADLRERARKGISRQARV